jgi:hypothetical protein
MANRNALVGCLVISSFVPVMVDLMSKPAHPWLTLANLASALWLGLCLWFLKASSLRHVWILSFALVALSPVLLTAYFAIAFKLGGFAP